LIWYEKVFSKVFVGKNKFFNPPLASTFIPLSSKESNFNLNWLSTEAFIFVSSILLFIVLIKFLSLSLSNTVTSPKLILLILRLSIVVASIALAPREDTKTLASNLSFTSLLLISLAIVFKLYPLVVFKVWLLNILSSNLIKKLSSSVIFADVV